MLFFVSDGKKISWHVGEPKNGLPGVVTEVTADCGELDHIRSKFICIPDNPSRRVVTWTGEIAQFIMNNL